MRQLLGLGMKIFSHTNANRPRKGGFAQSTWGAQSLETVVQPQRTQRTQRRVNTWEDRRVHLSDADPFSPKLLALRFFPVLCGYSTAANRSATAKNSENTKKSKHLGGSVPSPFGCGPIFAQIACFAIFAFSVVIQLPLTAVQPQRTQRTQRRVNTWEGRCPRLSDADPFSPKLLALRFFPVLCGYSTAANRSATAKNSENTKKSKHLGASVSEI